MSDSEITALAREYADMLKHLFPDMPEHTYRDKMSQAKNVINIIMRRFCLVEKEAIRKEYESVKDTPDDCNYEEHGATWDETPYLSRFYDEGYDCGQKNLLESLFPEIAKEV